MLTTLPVVTVISILTGFIKILNKTGYIIYQASKLTASGYKNIKSNQSLNLIGRCSMLAQMLQKADKSIITTNLGKNQQCVSC